MKSHIRPARRKALSLVVSLALCAGQLPVAALAQTPAEQGPAAHALAPAASQVHNLNKANAWNIQDELVMPGDTITITDELVESVRENGNLPDTHIVNDNYLALNMGGAHANTASKLPRSEGDPAKFSVAGTRKVNILGDYGPKTSDSTEGGGERTVNVAYVNDTGLPLRLSQWKSVSQDEGKAWQLSPVKAVIFEGFSTSLSAPLVTFYEPYYTLTYEGVPSSVASTLPDRYYVTNEQQTITLPKLNGTRPGEHFVGYSGPQFFDSDLMSTSKSSISYTFGWDDLRRYNFGDETVTADFEEGYTLTFHDPGSSFDGVTVEVDPIDNEVDVSAYLPERAGATFVGWCTSADLSQDSLLENGVLRTDVSEGYAVQLYAKWTGGSGMSDKEKALMTDGYYFDATSGELTFSTNDGIAKWYFENPGYESEEPTNRGTYADGIKSIVLLEGVTTTACDNYNNPAFWGLRNLTSVAVPKSLCYVVNGAFEDCSSLGSIAFPGDMVIFGQDAFAGCRALTSVTIAGSQVEFADDDLFTPGNPNLKISMPNAAAAAQAKQDIPRYASRINTSDTATYYGLVVNGVSLSDKTRSVKCGSGTASYDPATSTLTLTNATLNAYEHPFWAIDHHIDIAYVGTQVETIGILSALPSLTVKLVGTNTFESHVNKDAGTFSGLAEMIETLDGALTVEGPGTLRAQEFGQILASGDNDFMNANRAKGNIVLRDVAFEGPAVIDTFNGNITCENCTFEQLDLNNTNEGATTTLTRVTAPDAKINASSGSSRLVLNYAQINMTTQLVADKLTMNGGRLHIDVSQAGGLYTAPTSLEPTDVTLGAGTQVKQGSWNRAFIADDVLLVEGPSDGEVPDEPASLEERIAKRLEELCAQHAGAAAGAEFWHDVYAEVCPEATDAEKLANAEWYVIRDGKVKTSDWADYLGKGNWYYLNEQGKMLSGVQELTFLGKTGLYFFNEAHDGTFGAMKTGWFQDLAGTWYYGNELHDGEFGKLYAGGTFAIGGASYTFDAQGRWIG